MFSAITKSMDIVNQLFCHNQVAFNTVISDENSFLEVWKKVVVPTMTFTYMNKKIHFYEIISFVTHIKKFKWRSLEFLKSEHVPTNTMLLIKDEALKMQVRHYEKDN